MIYAALKMNNLHFKTRETRNRPKNLEAIKSNFSNFREAKNIFYHFL